MRYILDACALIYLTKANLFHEFMKLALNDVVIDKEVYSEVIVKGKDNNYPDADIADNYLSEYKIPIIPTNINRFIYYFRDPGETSCFVLAQDNVICITTDKKAFNKFKSNKVEAMRLDTFFFQQGKKSKFSQKKISDLLKVLLRINATTPERYTSIMELILKRGNKI